MAKEVFVPKLGQTMEEATLVRWLADDGAAVQEGQEILEVETDKSTFSIEANAKGFLHQGPFKPGQVVPVLTVVATIGAQSEAFAAAAPATQAHAASQAAEPSGVPVTSAAAGEASSPSGRAFASPRARKLATAKGVDVAQVAPTGYGGERVVERDVAAYLRQMPKATPLAQKVAAAAGIDLRAVPGTGIGGAVTKTDVERVQAPGAKESPIASPITATVPLTGIRAIIAERMAASVHTTARVTLFMEADATELVDLRERLKARVEKDWGFAPGYNDLIAKMVAAALVKFPYMNARLGANGIERLAEVNLGMAVDTERGLLVPVIRSADQKSLRRFGQEFRAATERARAGKSLPDELTGGTFTITNLGMYDVLAFTPVINLPEAAILGLGRIGLQPVVRDGQVVARQTMILSLVFDHRVVDGGPAARFLQGVKDLIEEPYLWAIGE